MKNKIVKAPDWLLELQDPQIKLQDRRKVGPWFLPPTQFNAKSFAASKASGSISITQGLSSKSNTQSFSKSGPSSIKQNLSSQSNSQSQAIRGQFYFATMLFLKGTALVQTFANGEESDLTSFVQLQGKAITNAFNGGSCVYYVNYASTSISPAYFSESSVAATINLQSKTLGTSKLKAEISGPYAKLLKLTSKVISQSKTHAELTQTLAVLGKALGQTFSIAKVSTAKALNSKSDCESLIKTDISINRELTSQEITQTISNVYEQIKVNLTAASNSQSLVIKGQEVLTRLLAAKATSTSYSTVPPRKLININSKMIGFSRGSVNGEVVTRLFNGIAESISVARQSLGSVNRLFVSGTIAQSFTKTRAVITQHLYSAFYSQTVASASEIISKPLQSQAKSPNPFHGEISKKINTQSPAATITISKAQEIVARPLAAKGASQNPFHANPDIIKLLDAEAKAASFAKAHGINQKLNLQSKAIVQSESINCQEVISRQLASSSLDTSSSNPILSKKILTTSKVIGQSEAKAQEIVARLLQSKIIAQSESIGDISSKRLITSEVIIESQAVAESPKVKINLLSKSAAQSEANVNSKVSRQLSAKSIDESFARADSLQILVNLYGSGLAQTFANSELMDKKLGLYSESVIQSSIVGTEQYLGNKIANIVYTEPQVNQDVINLAPFNSPDEFDNGQNNVD